MAADKLIFCIQSTFLSVLCIKLILLLKNGLPQLLNCQLFWHDNWRVALLHQNFHILRTWCWLSDPYNRPDKNFPLQRKDLLRQYLGDNISLATRTFLFFFASFFDPHQLLPYCIFDICELAQTLLDIIFFIALLFPLLFCFLSHQL